MARIAASALAAWLLAQPSLPPAACGHDRWAVKTLTDDDRDRVSLTPVPTTIRALRAIPVPEVPYPAARRMPEEFIAYTVRGRLVARYVEGDRDVHAVLADPDDPTATLITEVPLASCAEGSRVRATLDEARSLVLRAPLRSLLVVTGVGFFDFPHNAKGQAPNGFVLHPVFRVEQEAATETRDVTSKR